MRALLLTQSFELNVNVFSFCALEKELFHEDPLADASTLLRNRAMRPTR